MKASDFKGSTAAVFTDPFADGARPSLGKPGMISVPLSTDVAKKLDAARRNGETDDDVVSRVLNRWEGTDGSKSPKQMFPPGRLRNAAVAIESAMQGLTFPQRVSVLGEVQKKFPEFRSDTALSTSVKTAIETFGPEDQDAFLRILTAAKTPRDVTAGTISILDRRVDSLTEELRPKREAIASLQERRDAMEHVVRLGSAPRLGKLGESTFHKVLTAWDEKKIIYAVMPGAEPKPIYIEGIDKELVPMIGDQSQVFVVAHDWAAAFAKSEGFDGGEYRLPYEGCVFEMRVCGSRVAVSVGCFDGVPVGALLYAETPVGWAVAGFYGLAHGKWDPLTTEFVSGLPLMRFVGEQIRAIAISLEAKVAVTEIIRAPHRLNVAREKLGKRPVLDHHVVNLARRHRVAALPEDQRSNEWHARKRLHWRRAHWRYFSKHRTWIKWMLVGDPDLGFIDKEYRL